MAHAVSIVVPTFNRADDIRELLLTLQQQSCQDFDVIIVDNSSSDNTAAVISESMAAWPGRLQYHVKPPNGPASARNLGASMSDSHFLLFLDSDVRPHPDWIERALAHFSDHQQLGAVAGLVLYAFDPTLVNAFGGDQGYFGLCWDQDEATPRNQVSGPRRVIWANCSALMISRPLFDHIDGFDERYFYGHEDSELGWKVNTVGQEVWVFPDLEATHNVSPVPGEANDVIVWHYCKNRLCSLIKTTSTGGLFLKVPLLLGYTMLDAVLRAPRMVKLRALWWNIQQLRQTLELRNRLQNKRVVADKAIQSLGSGRWFPAERLSGQRRRGVPGYPLSATPGKVDVRADDRV